MGFFDDLKAAAIEKVQEKVKAELAELGIDLDVDDSDAEPEPEEAVAEEAVAEEAAAEEPPAQEDNGEERPVSAWSTPLNIATSSSQPLFRLYR